MLFPLPCCPLSDHAVGISSVLRANAIVGHIALNDVSLIYTRVSGAVNPYASQSMDRVGTGNNSSSLLPAIHSHLAQYALVFIPGLVTGRLFDMGHFRIPLALATAFLIVATFLVAQCKEYWQFLLCQGFAVGVRMPAVPPHFRR